MMEKILLRSEILYNVNEEDSSLSIPAFSRELLAHISFETPVNGDTGAVYLVNGYVFTQHENPELQVASALKCNPEDWTVLLRVPSAGDFQWGDVGDLFFMIHKSDLARANFSNVFNRNGKQLNGL